jgi:hypothetical protein
VPTARFTDVSTRDLHPLEVSWRVQHPTQQLAIVRLQLLALAQRLSRSGDPLGERVSHPLQLIEAGDARLTKATRHTGIEVNPGECLDAETRELVLQASDLTAQIGTGEALVASHMKRSKHLSIEQIHHKPEVECRSPSPVEKREPR